MTMVRRRSPIQRIWAGLLVHLRTARKSLRAYRKSKSALLLFPILLIAVLFAFSSAITYFLDIFPPSGQPALFNKFLGRQPFAIAHNESDYSTSRLHIAMIFDENRYDFSLSVIRSLTYYAKDPITLHLVAPTTLHDTLRQWPYELPGDVHVVTHDYKLCEAPTSLISHIARDIHMSAMCKVFLAEIVPSEHVLYIDSDVTVVSDVSYCWIKRGNIGTSLGRDAVIAMGVDMGEACQSNPDLCYPIGMRFKIPYGLECGTTPQRAKIVRAEGRRCQSAGEYEPYQFNGGVALMNLARMREQQFTARFVQASIHTWRSLGFRQARWGEQDLLNNFFRLYPKSIENLPCGCNYQYSAARRESKCGNQRVAIAHGWTRQLLDTKSHDRFNKHFNHFRRSDINYNDRKNIPEPPRAPEISRMAPDWSPPLGRPVDVAYREHDPSCSSQSHHCPADDLQHSQEVSIDILSDTVNILSRTSRRPRFFKEMMQTVQEQTHPHINHIVGTDDTISRATYLSNTDNVVSFTKSSATFDPSEVCRKCISPTGRCGSAPGLDFPKERQSYLDCYCSTAYPMNSYMNELQEKVKPGWVVYVDDDNMLEHKFSIAEMLSAIKSRKSLIAFRSHLGRLTPSDGNFERERIVMGDFDSSNFAFHTNAIQHATWEKKRCGDFRVARNLAGHLPVQWIDHTFIQANPLRAVLGGLGRRKDVGKPSVTVVVTSYLATGWRPQWVKQIVDTYTAEEMNHLVAKVILVWNNPTESVPQTLAELENERFVILRQKLNSLNNRWIDVLEHIDSEAVLNLDDDVYIKREGLICLLSWWKRDRRRIVGPFVRRIEGSTYVIDELTDSSEYSVVLPRVLLVPTALLKDYASKQHSWFHQYIDDQEAHCDDVFLNILAQKKAPPLRVLLPEKTMIDFYSKCFTVDSQLTGGLALQKDRAAKRSVCVRELMEKFEFKRFERSDSVATCMARGNALDLEQVVESERYKLMTDASAVQCTTDGQNR